MSSASECPTGIHRAARAGLWLLPVYAVLLGLSTSTHQPPISEFDAYARYVTTDVFLVSHLVASIFGASLGVLGSVGALAFLVHGRMARSATTGMVLTTVANVLMAAAFGSAAFVQPGIGRAHLNGASGMAELNSDTAYGPALMATIGVSSLIFIAAAITFGVAIARTSAQLRWAGIAYAVLLPTFSVTGIVYGALQPVVAFTLAAATAVLAHRLPRIVADSADRPAAPATSTRRLSVA